MQIIAFCEAVSDFRIVSGLVDRVFLEASPRWIGELLEVAPEDLREWRADHHGHAFFDIHRIDRYLEHLDVRPLYGHFDGEPGLDGALMVRTAFLIVNHLIESGTDIDAVVLVWDMDDEPKARRAGIAQARREALERYSFAIIIGAPNAMREAWVLAGFEAENDKEARQLVTLRSDLGFSPIEEAHRLDASDEQAKKSAKRVLGVLTGGDHDREAKCWTETPLATLRARSADTGLKEFLDEVEAQLVPLCARGA